MDGKSVHGFLDEKVALLFHLGTWASNLLLTNSKAKYCFKTQIKSPSPNVPQKNFVELTEIRTQCNLQVFLDSQTFSVGN